MNKIINDKLKSYGSNVVDLSTLTDDLDQLYGNDLELYWAKLGQFLEFFNSNSMAQIIEKLASDKYANIRELAALTIFELWNGWKIIKTDDRLKFHKLAKEYSNSLLWTYPILHKLLDDKRVGPAEIAVYSANEMQYAPINEKKLFRVHLDKIFELSANYDIKEQILIRYENISTKKQYYDMLSKASSDKNQGIAHLAKGLLKIAKQK